MDQPPVKTGLLRRGLTSGLRWLKQTCMIIGMIMMLGVGSTVMAPSVSKAAMAVIDQSVLAQAIEEVKAAKQQLVAAFEQIKWLTDIFSTLNDMVKVVQQELDAIGRLGRIELPWLNLMKSGQSLRRDIACLVPDLREMGIFWKDLKFRSICEGKDSYRKILFIPHDKNEQALTWQEHARLREEAEARRRALWVDIGTEAMAMAHLTKETQLEETLRGIEDLEDAAKRSQDMNSRLNVIAHGVILQNKQMAHLQKLMALQLQVQTAHFLADAVPASSRGDKTGSTTGTGPAPGKSTGSSGSGSGSSSTSGGTGP
ncbi:hypothetical protein [Novispirillum itersonii]|uniref:Uncharacterized protein n=1 Tax=Novispirillum itersonii TaxID=189 RepID=A0A7W9ZFP1_NOVIT|nr:hypothetical protein [Novispirillum itersonii]MBB6210637.1 hypothetical protein [Novispirillum itersonii]